MPAKSAKTKSIPLWAGAALGALSALALIGLLALGDRAFGFPFVPFDIFDWMSRTLPGGLIRFVIHSMVAIIVFLQGFLPISDISTASKLAEQSIAILQLVLGGAILGGLLAWIRRKRDPNPFGQIGGLVLLALTLIIEISLGATSVMGTPALWLAALFLAWGWGLAWLINRANTVEEEPAAKQLSRRQFLTVSGASLAAVALGSWGLSHLFGEESLPQQGGGTPASVSGDDPFGASLTSGPAASPSPAELATRPATVQGTRPELTSNEEFYRIDINTRPPEVDGSTWRLKVNGLVKAPLELSLDDLRALPAQTQILTMQCISNPIGGDLSSSSRWTGVRLIDVLNMAGIQDNVAGAYITSTDGFYEFVTFSDILDERTLLVYAMNGEPLPVEHGYPLRVYIPNRYGMKQPKWIETIELVAERADGYWVERGWSREAIPQTVSVVDTVVMDPDQGETGVAMAGGIAWAGTRGISKVEVQVDDGAWELAEVIAPPLSPLNWMLWRYVWPAESGRHTLNVRAYDGDGQLQITQEQGTFPDGAMGIHSVTVNL